MLYGQASTYPLILLIITSLIELFSKFTWVCVHKLPSMVAMFHIQYALNKENVRTFFIMHN